MLFIRRMQGLPRSRGSIPTSCWKRRGSRWRNCS